MKENYTHIAVVLDSSGSMGSILNDTIGGFNAFLKAQKEAPGEATFTLVEFAQPGIRDGFGQSPWNPLIGGVLNDGKPIEVAVNVKYNFVDIKTVPELSNRNYLPFGGTPLLDTIGETINRTGISLAALPETLRPSKVLFVIITDGEENASRVYTHKRVMEMIAHQSSIYKWEFMYLGANQDAIRVGASFGIGAARSMSYGVSAEALGSTYGLLATKTTAFRAAQDATVATAALNFTDEERESVKDKQ